MNRCFWMDGLAEAIGRFLGLASPSSVRPLTGIQCLVKGKVADGEQVAL